VPLFRPWVPICGCRSLTTAKTLALESFGLHLREHADEHGSERPILLAVDQELSEGAGLGVPQYEPIRSARSILLARLTNRYVAECLLR
jgi:hypothetical protein